MWPEVPRIWHQRLTTLFHWRTARSTKNRHDMSVIFAVVKFFTPKHGGMRDDVVTVRRAFEHTLVDRMSPIPGARESTWTILTRKIRCPTWRNRGPTGWRMHSSRPPDRVLQTSIHCDWVGEVDCPSTHDTIKIVNFISALWQSRPFDLKWQFDSPVRMARNSHIFERHKFIRYRDARRQS